MMKLPGISAGASRLAGATDESGGAAGAMKTMGNVLHLPQGGAAGARQENSDLSKVVEDLLHDKLMGKMNGSAGGGTDPLGSRHLPQAEGGQGPEVARPSFGGLQQSGGQSPLQGLQQENGDLKKLLQDLLKPGGSDGQAAPGGAQSGQGLEMPRFRIGTVAQPPQGQGAQQAGAQGENGDLMKLVEDLLKDKSASQGASGDAQSSGPQDLMQQMMQSLQQENEKMKGLMSMMQQSMQQSSQQSPLAMLQNMMQSTQQSPLADLQKMMQSQQS